MTPRIKRCDDCRYCGRGMCLLYSGKCVNDDLKLHWQSVEGRNEAVEMKAYMVRDKLITEERRRLPGLLGS